jgi:heme-degrading monooxygenase HmoA
MPYLLVRHKVEDYEKWKPVFNEHSKVRRASGSKGGHLFRNADDPNEIVVLLEWDTVEKARKFAHSKDLQQAMQRAGVTSKPEMYFLDEIEQVKV